MQRTRFTKWSDLGPLQKLVSWQDSCFAASMGAIHYLASGNLIQASAIASISFLLETWFKPKVWTWNSFRKSLGFEKSSLSYFSVPRALGATAVSAGIMSPLLLDINPPLNTRIEWTSIANTAEFSYLLYRGSQLFNLSGQKSLINLINVLSRNNFSAKQTIQKHPEYTSFLSTFLKKEQRLAHNIEYYLEPQNFPYSSSALGKRKQIFLEQYSSRYLPLEYLADEEKEIYLQVHAKSTAKNFEEQLLHALYAHRYSLSSEAARWNTFFVNSSLKEKQLLRPGLEKESFSFGPFDDALIRTTKYSLSEKEISLEQHIENKLKSNTAFFAPVTIPQENTLIQLYYDRPTLREVLETSSKPKQEQLLTQDLENLVLLQHLVGEFTAQDATDFEKKHLSDPFIQNEKYISVLRESASFMMQDQTLVPNLDYHADNRLYNEKRKSFVTLDHELKGLVPVVTDVVNLFEHRYSNFHTFEDRIALALDYVKQYGLSVSEFTQQYLHLLMLRQDAFVRAWSAPGHQYVTERIAQLERGISTFEQLAIYDPKLASAAQQRIEVSELLIQSI